MTISEWKEDFKSFINELQMPRDDYNGIMSYIDEGAELLREQEPRVITREELKQFEGSPCWFESSGTYRGKDGFWIIPAMFHTFFAGTIMNYVSASDGVGDCGELGLPAYNKAWRCWTAKPTDEQKKKVQWNAD